MKKKTQVSAKKNTPKNKINPEPIVHLTSLGLGNFKPFGENYRVGSKENESGLYKFAPLTFILGKNSSGKSSIIQSLNLLSQSYNESEGIRILRGRGKLSNLGAYEAYIHRQNKKNQLSYSFTLEEELIKKPKISQHGYQYKFIQNKKTNRGQLESFRFFKDFVQPKLGDKPHNGIQFVLGYLFDTDNKKRRDTFCKLLPESLDDNNTGKELLEDIKIDYKKESKLKITNKKIKEVFRIFDIETTKGGLPLQLGVPTSTDRKDIDKVIKDLKKNVMPYAITDRVLKRFLSSLRQPLRALFDRYEYIGPSREVPTRTQIKKGSDTMSVGVSGENAADILLDNKKTILKSMNGILEMLNVPYEIEIKNYSDITIESTYSVVLKDKRTNVTVSTYDVGYGIFQFIPVIVQGLFPSRNIIACEQPEIHLHPALVADLADYFIETSNLPIKNREFNLSKEFIKNNKFVFGNQWIIETHSELLLRRILKRIREGKIKNTDVSVLYVEPATSKHKSAQILELRIDSDGEFIDRWPDGFFDEAINEF